MDVLTISDFDKICRTCLMRNENYLYSIFTSNVTEPLMECTGVKVSFNDGLPTLICENCIQNVYQAINFKRNCLNSQQILQNILKNNEGSSENAQKIKEETDDKNFLDYIRVEIKKESSVKDSVNDEEKGPTNEEVSNSLTIEPKASSDECETRSLSPIDLKICDKFFGSKVKIKHQKSGLENKKSKRSPKKRKVISKDSDKVEKPPPNPSSTEVTSETNEQTEKEKEEEFFYCRICDKFFETQVKLRRHQKVIHEGEQIRKMCNICNKTYVHLSRHVFVKHGGDGAPYKCNVCNQRFSCRYYLGTHIREKHEGIKLEKPALCTLCGKSFKTGGELNKHKLIHSDERNFKCEICGKAYKVRGALTDHRKTHSEKRYACTYCDKKFFTNTLLQRHIRIHTDERPYACSICSKTFRQKSILDKHMRCIHKTI